MLKQYSAHESAIFWTFQLKLKNNRIIYSAVYTTSSLKDVQIESLSDILTFLQDSNNCHKFEHLPGF